MIGDGEDASLPACCRRHGAHRAPWLRAWPPSSQLHSASPFLNAPATCPNYPTTPAATTSTAQALVAAPSAALSASATELRPSNSAAARISQIRVPRKTRPSASPSELIAIRTTAVRSRKETSPANSLPAAEGSSMSRPFEGRESQKATSFPGSEELRVPWNAGELSAFFQPTCGFRLRSCAGSQSPCTCTITFLSNGSSQRRVVPHRTHREVN